LAAIPLYLLLHYYLSLPFYLLLLIFSLYPVAALCHWAEVYFAQEDPSRVVIDEVIGYLVTMAALPASWFTVISGFFIFRFFDVLKPYPVYQSQQISQGWGVLIDDVLAGIYSNLSLWLVYLGYRHFII